MRHNLLAISSDHKLNDRLESALAADCAVMPVDPRAEDLEAVARRFNPSGIVMDANAHPGAKTILERIADVRAQFPALPLIVIGDEMSAQLILAAFRAGADDFLDRDSSDMEMRALLLSRLNDSHAKNGTRGTSTLLGVLSPTPSDEDHDLALNIAMLLAAGGKERRILLLDMSLPASPVRLALGLELNFTVNAAIRDMARLDETFLDSALARASETGLYVLPLADKASDAATLPSLRDVSVLLQMLRSLFDVVVVCWGAFSRQAAMTGSQGENTHFLLGCNQRFSSIRNAKEFLAELKLAQKGQPEPVLAIHQVDPELAPAADDIVRATGAVRSITLRANTSALIAAQNRGRPLSLAGPSHYADALRTYLTREGLQPVSAPSDNRAANLLQWLRRVAG